MRARSRRNVIGPEKAPFEKQLGHIIGAAFIDLHEKHGVAFRFSTEVTAPEGDKNVRSVALHSGERIPADLVVIGFGVAPATGYADSLSRAGDGGILVDASLQATEGLYAAGDIAHFPHRGDGTPIRVEHWRVAQQQGRVAALNMLGHKIRYDAVPVFWTIQYLKRLDYVGHATGWDDIIVHGDLKKPEFIAYYVKDDHVVAAAGLNRDRDMAAVIELLTFRRRWRPAELGETPARVLEQLPV
ncbi:MAG TPA: FAD-dependent oxidoreductase [Acetobacteraceae bacterium]|nr:FAD-dependent oxidoreductase [Acetobacteraceae bacterium]